MTVEKGTADAPEQAASPAEVPTEEQSSADQPTASTAEEEEAQGEGGEGAVKQDNDELSEASDEAMANELGRETSVGAPGDAELSAGNAAAKRHFLREVWTMWHDGGTTTKGGKYDSWHVGLRKIVSFNTVEDFWCLLNNLTKPSELGARGNYHLFKEAVMPAWEDPANAKGGRWVLELPRGEMETRRLNKLWLYVILALIGEAMQDADDVCGAVVSLRKQKNRISLWTRSATDKEKQLRIGKQLRAVLELDDDTSLTYQEHVTPASPSANSRGSVSRGSVSRRSTNSNPPRNRSDASRRSVSRTSVSRASYSAKAPLYEA